MKKVLLGNEAFARGAYEYGVVVAAAYPGTPSTEIMENIAKHYPEIYCEWSPNEKVAVEVAMGASFAGVRALASMKHVGVNVAADPVMTFSYVGVEGGFVLITADDPNMHSSQNEQDNRNYARFSRIPMLEPSDSQEAKDFVGRALEISEKFDTPVFVRSTTRLSHGRSVVQLGERMKVEIPKEIKKNPRKYTMLPANARVRHRIVEERTEKLKEFVNTSPLNRIEKGDTKIGIITSGIPYMYAKEVLPEASYLKLGIVWPLPEKLIKEFIESCDEIYVVEELDPFFEGQIREMGYTHIHGKDVLPICGELSPAIIEKAILGRDVKYFVMPREGVPPRPPNMCPGCPHRGMFYVLKKLDLYVSGDIGCYTLGALPPIEALHSCVCMGASVGNAHGISKALGKNALGKHVAIIGESTFLHNGVTPLMDVVYNKGNSTTIILDNKITAMTGHQETPASGYTIRGEKTHAIDFVELAKALGVKEENIRVVNPYDVEMTENAIKEETQKDEPSVIISEGPCVLLRRALEIQRKPYSVDAEKCVGCRNCLKISCPAISWVPREELPEEIRSKKKEKIKGVVKIDPLFCPGCGLCYQICKVGAIVPPEGEEGKYGFMKKFCEKGE